jgi:hypothetical protein
MHKRKRLFVAVAAGVALTAFTFHAPLEAQGRGRGRPAPKQVERSDREPPRWSLPGRVIPQKYEEPAFARGYEAGRERGLADARDGERYDPVASREYRDGDPGYAASYGSRDAYKSNYRAGYRQGYEEGYRKMNR